MRGGRKNLWFFTNKSLYLNNSARQGLGYHWSLIGSRTLALDCHWILWPWMTLNAKIKVIMDFFGYFGLWDTFQKWIASKSIEMDIEKLHMKFSALNVDFNGPSLDLLGSRKPAHAGIKHDTLVEVVILPLLASLAWKQLQRGTDMLPIRTSTSDKLFSCCLLYTSDAADE